MTSEDEARALIERLRLVERDGYLSATYLANEHVGELMRDAADAIGSLLASRVSTPPNPETLYKFAEVMLYPGSDYPVKAVPLTVILSWASGAFEPVRHISDKRASGMEPTDEDEREALATILANGEQVLGKRVKFVDCTFDDEHPVKLSYYGQADAAAALHPGGETNGN
jgi:hypothetical protein